MLENEWNVLCGQIFDASIEVHKHLGLGLLESVYEICLCNELINKTFSLNDYIFTINL